MDRKILKTLEDIAKSLRIISGRDTLSRQSWTSEEAEDPPYLVN